MPGCYLGSDRGTPAFGAVTIQHPVSRYPRKNERNMHGEHAAGRFCSFFMWQRRRSEALRLLADKEERRDLEPGAQLLPGTGHLKWRHVYVIMTTEFDYFENDHILYTVGNNCKKRKKYPSCCAMLTLPHFSSVRKTEKERVRIGSGTSTELSANNGAFMIVTIKGKRNG